MAKKCIICLKEAEYCIKDSNECYCKECAAEHFGDLNYLQTIEEQAIALRKMIDEKMMTQEQEAVYEKVHKEFEQIKADNKLEKEEEPKFISDATELLGVYNIVNDIRLYDLLRDMVDFGNDHGFAMQGVHEEWKHIKVKWG